MTQGNPGRDGCPPSGRARRGTRRRKHSASCLPTLLGLAVLFWVPVAAVAWGIWAATT